MPPARVWVLVAVAVLGIGAAAFYLLGDADRQTGSHADPVPERSVDLELLSWRCGHENVVTADQIIEAKGEFCFVAMNLTNRGEAPAILEASCQYLLDGMGARFAVRPDVMALDPGSRDGFGRPIGPGALVEDAALYYDVPKGTRPEAVELHEDCEQPGFRLPLDPALEGAPT